MANTRMTGMMVYTLGIFPIGVFLPLIMTIILIYRHKISFHDKNFIRILVVVLFWIFFIYLKYGHIVPNQTVFLIYNIIVAYILVRVFSTSLFYLYEKYLTVLSVISLLGVIFYLLMPGLISDLVSVLDVRSFRDTTTVNKGNIIIFTLTNSDIYSDYFFYRNSGFSWEPGRFSSMVVIALFFNLARTKCKLKNNKNFWILLLTLFSTLSTTGISNFIVLLLMIFVHSVSGKNFVPYIVILPILIVAVITLPMMHDKISELYVADINKGKILEQVANNDDFWVPQRFEGLSFEWLNIIHDPILGYGLHWHDSWIYNNIGNILPSNGILSVFAKFGVFIGLLFYLLLYQASKWISQFYKIKGWFWYMLIFMLISISYEFTHIPFYLAIIFSPIFLEYKIQNITIINSRFLHYNNAKL
jgi:hypothetical protein